MKLHPEKDQHLLINEKMIERIIKESDLSKKDFVIEIGAGSGILRSELAEYCEKVLALELDKNFEKELEKMDNKNLKIIYKNALDYSWEGYDKIISNIPYSISESVIMKAIEENIPFMVLMVGENFKKILEKKNTKIGILGDLFFEMTFVMKVKKENFNPKPRVDSWIVKFVRKENLTNSEKIIQNIVIKKGKIKNAILYSLVESGKTKNQARKIIDELKIDKNILEKSVKSITGKFLMLLRERLDR